MSFAVATGDEDTTEAGLRLVQAVFDVLQTGIFPDGYHLVWRLRVKGVKRFLLLKAQAASCRGCYGTGEGPA